MYLQAHGAAVELTDDHDRDAFRARHGIPDDAASCHTAVVDGYVIEGHVPVEEIRRLLSERPEVAGIAVAGMPAGSPGMEIEGLESEPYDVVTFDPSGAISLYASYPK